VNRQIVFKVSNFQLPVKDLIVETVFQLIAQKAKQHRLPILLLVSLTAVPARLVVVVQPYLIQAVVVLLQLGNGLGFVLLNHFLMTLDLHLGLPSAPMVLNLRVKGVSQVHLLRLIM